MRNFIYGLFCCLTMLALTGWCRADTPTVQAKPSVLGGVFLDGEPVRWDVSGGPVRWRVTDFSGADVGAGIAPGTSLTLPLRRHGYFVLHLSAGAGPERDFPFAILAPPPLPRADSPFGVMTHFAQGWNQDIIPLLARAGVAQVRDEQYWNHVEKTPGQFVYPPSFEAYMARLGQVGVTSLTPLTFENDHYDGGQTPYTQAGFDGYARYGQNVLTHFGRQIRAVDIFLMLC